MNLGTGKKLLKLLLSNNLKPVIGHDESVIYYQGMSALYWKRTLSYNYKLSKNHLEEIQEIFIFLYYKQFIITYLSDKKFISLVAGKML